MPGFQQFPLGSQEVSDLSDSTQIQRFPGFLSHIYIKEDESEIETLRAWLAESLRVYIYSETAETRKPTSLAVSVIQRFMVMYAEQVITAVLWLVHTHLIEQFEITPYLNLCSPTRGNAKSRLSRLLAFLSARGEMFEGITGSSLTRLLNQQPPPTLIIDELNQPFQPETPETVRLRRVLNAGYVLDGSERMTNKGTHNLEVFKVWGPKVLSGLADLPHDTKSRCIPITLRRRAEDEVVERLRYRKAKVECEVIRIEMGIWAQTLIERLPEDPEMPEELSDRETDIWEPLVAIADAIGEPWGEWSRICARLLRFKAEDDETDPKIMLLRDIKGVMDTLEEPRIRSAELLMRLVLLTESPWGDYGKRGELTSYQLSQLLKGFKIHSKQVKSFGTKGFEREQFEHVWAEYRIM